MTIKKIKKYGLIITIIGVVLIGIIFREISLITAYLVGSLASFICLFINEHFLTFDESRNVLIRNLSGFILRMFIYVLALSFAFKLGGLEVMIVTFVGCLTIRIAVLIYGIKGVR